MFYTIVKVIIKNEKKELVDESSVKKTTKKKLKIKLNKKSKNKTDNNISLDINEFVTDESLKEVTKNNLEQAEKKDDFQDESQSDSEYSKHYVSFAILFPFDYGISTNPHVNYLLGTNILVKNRNMIRSYEIDLTPEFKYKKFIRSKVLEDFNYKNKDIFIIKSINNYKNYHNYIVVLKNKSVRHKQYPNMISSVSDSYKWKQIYDMYNPAKMTPDVKDFTVKDGYKYLGEKSPLNITFTDDKSSNHIDLKDIYKSMVLVM